MSQVMNTTGRMDRQAYTSLLILCCFIFVNTYGKGQDLLPSCEIDVMVWRGTTWKTSVQQHLTVQCPVKHCGQSLTVTWCKLVDNIKCERINYTENVEIRQMEKYVGDKLISYLTFTRISIHDDGLYRCDVKRYKDELISHTINISVSDSNEGVKQSHSLSNAVELRSTTDAADVTWLPYFFICLGIALLVFTVTILTLSLYGWERILKHTKRQQGTHEISTHIIPNLPNGGSTLILHDTYSPSTAERPLPQPPRMMNVDQPAVTNTASERQLPECAVYAAVNHRLSGIHAREQHAATTQNKNAAYATINGS